MVLNPSGRLGGPMKKGIACVITLAASLSGANYLASPSAKPRVFEVPFDFYHNSVILQVKVDGKGPFNMLLDTGTDPSAFDINTAKELGLRIDSVDVGGQGAGSDKIETHRVI